VAPYRGGWLAVERRQGAPYVVHLDATGTVTSRGPGGDGIAVSQDGLEISWAEAGRLYLDSTNGHSESPRSIRLPKGAAGTPVAFVGPGSVVARIDSPDQPFWVTDFSDFQVVRGALGIRATDQAHGVLGVQTSYDSSNGTSCWAVRTNTGGDREPKTCEWTIESFSPGGAHLVGYPSDTDGIGSASVALLDARTLDVVARFDRPDNSEAFVSDVVWEDDSHVLASLFEDGAWHLVRLGLDGSVANVDELPGHAEDSPFHFAARP
jgi:hypothetical protein